VEVQLIKREKCSRCRKLITEQTGRNVSIHRGGFQLSPNVTETIYCDPCHGHNRSYRGRTTEEMAIEAKDKIPFKIFTQEEIDSVAHLYSRSGKGTAKRERVILPARD
jgi:hypothetical protein